MKKITKAVIGVCSAVVLCAGAFCIYRFAVLPASEYRTAIALMENADYESAIAAFSTLGGYSDSKSKLKECENLLENARLARIYASAAELFENGEYANAEDLFRSISAFSDSRYMADECVYRMASACADADPEIAASLFESINGHKDSEALRLECLYDHALRLIEKRKYDEAETILYSIPNYKDSKALAESLISYIEYDIAMDYYAKEQYQQAIPILQALGDFKNSAALAESLLAEWYAKAEAWLNEDNFDMAYSAFGWSARYGYKDSAERQNQVRYLQATENMKNGNYSSAKFYFSLIPDYLDSNEMSVLCNYLDGLKALDDKNFSYAKRLFAELGDYRDSAQMLLETDYLVALQLFDAEKYDEAKVAFAALGDYSDSKSMLKEIDYVKASKLLSTLNYSEARKAFEALGNYKDSAELAAKAISFALTGAKEYMDKGSFLNALNELEPFSDLSEAYELILEAKYCLAEKYLDMPSYQGADDALHIYRELGDYRDSKEKLALIETLEEKYNLAVDIYESGNLVEACGMFEELGHYSYSYERFSELRLRFAREALENGAFAKAEELALDVYSSSSFMNELYYRWAEYLYAEGDLAGAVRMYGRTYWNGDADDKLIAIISSPEYRKVATVGDTVIMGQTQQDEIGVPSPIEWYVFRTEDDHIWLVSKKVLSVMPFGEKGAWESSKVREWLNGAFLEDSFSDEEKLCIVERERAAGVTDAVSLVTSEELAGNDEWTMRYPAPTYVAYKMGAPLGNVSWSGSVSNWFLLDGSGALDDQTWWFVSEMSGVRPVICVGVN